MSVILADVEDFDRNEVARTITGTDPVYFLSLGTTRTVVPPLVSDTRMVPCIVCAGPIAAPLSKHGDCHPIVVPPPPTVTITADLSGWYVTDGGRYWTPATTAEAALSPADFARQVAARVGAVYVAPYAACVPAPCDSCDNSMSGLVEEPLPTRCYTCAHGPILPLAWTWQGPTAAQLAAQADAGLRAMLDEAPVTVGRAA